MRLTLDGLVVLDAIDCVGSFAGAAERLHRVPSAISYTVHKLEQDLGVVLFDRAGHRAKLTAAGARLLKEGRALLQQAQEIERRVRDVGDGCEASLAIVLSDVVARSALYPMLSAFYDAPGHEGTCVQVKVETQSACLDTLLAGHSDLVIGVPEPGRAVDGVHTQTLGAIELCLVVLPAHPLARAAEPLSWRGLAPYRMVRQASTTLGMPDGQLSDGWVTVDSFASQLDAIRHGLGIGCVPTYLVSEDIACGRLVAKVVADVPTLRVAAAWRAMPVGRALGWFVDRLRDEAVRTCLAPPARNATAERR